MTNKKVDDFTGRWLHQGDRRGQDFTHSASDYDHADHPESEPVKMRHATVKQGDKAVKVWAPENWTEEQIAEALETNW
jgi:hypothetical protein